MSGKIETVKYIAPTASTYTLHINNPEERITVEVRRFIEQVVPSFDDLRISVGQHEVHFFMPQGMGQKFIEAFAAPKITTCGAPNIEPPKQDDKWDNLHEFEPWKDQEKKA